MNRIASFSVNHDYIVPGIYVSRIDGDITTYDLRTRKPNTGDLMDNAAMHSMEHMFATFVRNSDLSDKVIYFGPMGCQTGFYLLMREADDEKVIALIQGTLRQILAYEGPVFGATREECGNYINLSLDKAKAEAERYLKSIENWNVDQLKYPEA
ncbi:MAG: S-ribosylhomocysteine lyase [Clostridia bacterium]|nr:S-ribosylhomocysteine lyase [Clostridia bacterium]